LTAHLAVKSERRTKLKPQPILSVDSVIGAVAMPYALFCNDARLSKAYPTEADVWNEARKSGLVVDIASDEEMPAPRPVLENDYEIRPCRPDPHEDPARNKAEAERQALIGLEFSYQASAVEA
jgi:hypothetical protein